MKRLYVLAIMLLCSINAMAANFYWVGGNGNWSDFQHHWALNSGGSVFQTTVPSAFDDVIFDNNSFPSTNDTMVVIDMAIAYTKNITFSNGSKKTRLQFASNSYLLYIYGSATFAEGTVIPNYPKIYFKSESLGCTITLNNSKWSSATEFFFDGVGGSWKLTDSITISYIKLINGTLDITGQKITCNTFESENANNRTFLFDNAKIITRRLFFNTNNLTSSGLHSIIKTEELYVRNSLNKLEVDTIIPYNTESMGETFSLSLSYVSANVINYSGKGRIFIENCTIQKAFIDSTSISIYETFIGEAHFNALTKLQLPAGTLTTQNLIFTGNDCLNPINIEGNPPYICSIKQASGSVVFNYAVIKNIVATGGASFTAINSNDEENNSGITFSPNIIQTFYWIGNNGDWEDPLNWSLSSGGASQGCVPRSVDNIVYDENSFMTSSNEHVILAPPCATLDARNVTQRVYFDNFLTISGSIYLSPLIASPAVFFTSFNTGNVIDFNGAFGSSGQLIFNGTGDWTLMDSISTGYLRFQKGTFHSNGFHVRSSESIMDEGGFADFSHSTIDAASLSFSNSSGNFSTTKIILYKSSYNININIQTPIGEIIAKTTSTIYANHIGKLTIYNDAFLTCNYNAVNNTLQTDTLVIQEGITLKISANARILVDSISIIGSPSCKKQTIISSSYIQLPAIFAKNSGVVRLSDIALLSIKAEGGATFIAERCADMGGNSGWQIQRLIPKTYYWINDSGDWADEMHWSLSSAGLVSGCIPGIQDHVVFDEASFSSPNHIITATNNSVQISGLLVQGVPGAISLPLLLMYGNAELDPKLTQTISISFVGKGTMSLKSNGLKLFLLNNIADTLIILDDLQSQIFTATRGYIDMQNKKSHIDRIDWQGQSDSLIVNMKNSFIQINSECRIATNRMRTIAKGSTLLLNSSASTPAFINGYEANKIKLDRVELTDQQAVDEYFIAYTILNKVYIENLVVNSKASRSFFSIVNSEIQHFFLKTPASLNTQGSYVHTFQTYKAIETSGSFKVDYLRLESGTRLKANAGDTLYITEYLDAIGNSSFPITIESSQGGQQIHLRCTTGIICCAYLNLSNTHAFGGAQFFAGPSSTNISNNSGWNFGGTCDVLSINANLPGCEGRPITINTTHPPQVNGFLWVGPNGFASNQKNIIIPSLNAQNVGLYSLLAGGQIRKILLVTESKPDTIITTDQSSVFFESSAISSTNNYTIDWYKDGNLLNGVHTNKLNTPATGLYYSVFTTPAGCSYQSNTILYDVELLGIDSPTSTYTILIKPIPVQDYLTIELNHPDLTQVTIFDQIGKILLSEKINLLSSVQLDLTTLLQGVYIIKISTTQKEFYKRFIKQ